MFSTKKNSHCIKQDCGTFFILKTFFINSNGDTDETEITAYSYDIEQRTDMVSVKGGDGYYHSVPVQWDDYLPLMEKKNFFISKQESVQNENIMASRKGLCIFK